MREENKQLQQQDLYTTYANKTHTHVKTTESKQTKSVRANFQFHTLSLACILQAIQITERR